MRLYHNRSVRRAVVPAARSTREGNQITSRPRRSWLRVLAAAMLVGAAALTGLSSAAPAQAATCVTEGHAYLTQPGFVYFSGYNGDRSLGVPRLIVEQGERFSYGGNGIGPSALDGVREINWQAARISGLGGEVIGQINFLNGQEVDDQAAGDNCVANEKGPFPVMAPPGFYLIQASYTPGKHPGMFVRDRVVELEVRRGPQTADVAASTANGSTSSTSAGDSLLGTPPPSGGGGGGGTDPDPNPCGIQICPIAQ